MCEWLILNLALYSVMPAHACRTRRNATGGLWCWYGLIFTQLWSADVSITSPTAEKTLLHEAANKQGMVLVCNATRQALQCSNSELRLIITPLPHHMHIQHSLTRAQADGHRSIWQSWHATCMQMQRWPQPTLKQSNNDWQACYWVSYIRFQVDTVVRCRHMRAEHGSDSRVIWMPTVGK